MGNCKFCCKKLIKGTYIGLPRAEGDDDSSPIQIYQMSDTNTMLPQGDFKKFENGDLIIEFLKKPLVKIYIDEIFRPNKSIQEFHYEKIKGIYEQIKPLIDELSKRTKLKYNIPKNNLKIRLLTYKIECTPATIIDLDNYMPIFFLEWAIYPKSFIKRTKLKALTFVHQIKCNSDGNIQTRAGCPETTKTESLILSTEERNFVYIRIVLHHELFHYIDWVDDYSYEDIIWETFNVPGFKYGKGGEYEREWIQLDKKFKGFINHYSTSALEEDRAEIYQYLIGCPDEALNHKDEIIKKKSYRIKEVLCNFDKDGIGDPTNNFFSNLKDYRNKFAYKESVFNGNVH
ncbi:MAG: hypothetical protein MJ252_20950 [archaeon]|nr:hypothetical protein [archaeon]